MKLTLSPIALSLAMLIQPVQADLISDSEHIMDAAQQVYSELFPSAQATQTLGPWIYRFYPTTGIYVGINQQDSGVYLLGGAFGSSPYYVGQASDILAILQSQLDTTNNNQNDICDTRNIPDGFSYNQTGNTITVTTNGQCIQLPEVQNFCDTIPETDTSGQPVATGIHVLTQTNIISLDFSGIEINIPGFPNPLDSTAQDLINNTNTCLINAPTELTNYTVNSDICLDITNQLGTITSIPGMLDITPPVTTHFTGTSLTTVVNDCFATSAATIIDLVTQATWVKNETGVYTQIN